MVAKAVAPVRGGIYLMNFDPTIGHEQSGFRPAVVISEESYNEKVGLALVCAVTSARKGYPFEVTVESKNISGVILADQVRSVDWRARRLRYVGTISAGACAEVQTKILSLVQ